VVSLLQTQEGYAYFSLRKSINLTNIILNIKNMKLFYNNLNIIICTLIFNIFCCSAQTFDSSEIINGHDFDGKVKAFDADRDGDLDILAFPYLYLNDGKGKNQKLIEITNRKDRYEDYAIMDMDGDKDIDIVVLYKNGKIEILINEIKGFVKKEQKKEVTYMPSEYAKLYLYDANSDGIRDIIILGLKGVPIAYIGDKNLQFSYFNQFNQQFSNINFIHGLDINKDSKEELITYNYSNQITTLNAYSFKDNKYNIVDSITLTTRGFNNLKLADIDGDGDQDLVYNYGYPDGAIYWIERNNKGGFGKISTLVSQINVEDFRLSDFDSDGDLDLVYFTQKGQDTFINWAKNSGKNMFIKNQKSLLPNIKDSQTFIFEDFDGDKIKDILFHSNDNNKIRPRYEMILQDINGLIKEQNNWMISSKCDGFVLSDIDNNGTKDIIGYYKKELFYILKNSNGKYSESKELTTSAFEIENLKCFDINNDGKEDLMISSDDDNGKIGYYINEGDLVFEKITMLHEEADRMINFEILDYDNDGYIDVSINYWKNDLRGIYVYKNLGNGVFNKNRIVVTETKVSNSFPRLALWDVNNDGVLDILDNGSSSWFKYLGKDSWAQESSPFKDKFIKVIQKANLDNDKTIDCIMSNGRLVSLKYDSQNQWKNKIIPVDFSVEMLCVGDLNGDSIDDLVCLAEKSGFSEGFQEEITISSKYSIISLLNNQTENFVSKTLFPVSNINNIVLDDVDNDGDLDIIISSSSWLEGGITVWKNSTKK
jgi:hypothetical protein